MKKIGIIGGTFDPVHTGHLFIANEVRERLALDQIWFIPNKIPPHKERMVTSSEHRLEMIRLAIMGNEYFKVNSLEIDREGRSYTFDTITLLKEMYPDYSFYFIIGGDMVEYLPKWYNIDELSNIVQFVGVTRVGYELDTPYSVEILELPTFEISSSMVRERVQDNQTIMYLVPDSVREYIKEHQLYE